LFGFELVSADFWASIDASSHDDSVSSIAEACAWQYDGDGKTRATPFLETVARRH